MDSNVSFIVTFTLMMLTVMILSGMFTGCTQLDRLAEDDKMWSIEVRGTPAECAVLIEEHNSKTAADDSLTMEMPNK